MGFLARAVFEVERRHSATIRGGAQDDLAARKDEKASAR
jgi:hypothetical protein